MFYVPCLYTYQSRGELHLTVFILLSPELINRKTFPADRYTIIQKEENLS